MLADIQTRTVECPEWMKTPLVETLAERVQSRMPLASRRANSRREPGSRPPDGSRHHANHPGLLLSGSIPDAAAARDSAKSCRLARRVTCEVYRGIADLNPEALR